MALEGAVQATNGENQSVIQSGCNNNKPQLLAQQGISKGVLVTLISQR